MERWNVLANHSNNNFGTWMKSAIYKGVKNLKKLLPLVVMPEIVIAIDQGSRHINVYLAPPYDFREAYSVMIR